MSLAARARDAAREHPFLMDALRAGVVNYRAAAEFLEVDGDAESVATALRRFADGMDDPAGASREARVTVRRGVGTGEGDADEALLAVNGVGIYPDAGSAAAVQAAGDVDARALESVLGRLRTGGVAVDAAGVAGGTLLVVVGGRESARAVRLVEAGLESRPERSRT